MHCHFFSFIHYPRPLLLLYFLLRVDKALHMFTWLLIGWSITTVWALIHITTVLFWNVYEYHHQHLRLPIQNLLKNLFQSHFFKLPMPTFKQLLLQLLRAVLIWLHCSTHNLWSSKNVTRTPCSEVNFNYIHPLIKWLLSRHHSSPSRTTLPANISCISRPTSTTISDQYSHSQKTSLHAPVV